MELGAFRSAGSCRLSRGANRALTLRMRSPVEFREALNPSRTDR